MSSTPVCGFAVHTWLGEEEVTYHTIKPGDVRHFLLDCFGGITHAIL
jgi:hypothetical protein